MSTTLRAIWKAIWNSDGLPKIKMFCWTLSHGKILTAEKLQKCGIEGPSRCPLCKQNEEVAVHLFLECAFSNALCNIAFSDLNIQVDMPRNWKEPSEHGTNTT